MKPSQTYHSSGPPLMLVAALFSAGCEFSQLPGLRSQAVILCVRPWGLFVVVEVALITMLVASVLAREFVCLIGYLVRLQPLRFLLRAHITKRRTDSGCVVLQVHDAARGTSWWLLSRQLAVTPEDAPGVIVDLSLAPVVRDTFLASLCRTQKEWTHARKRLEIIGLNS